MLPNAVITITGVRRSWLRRFCSSSSPLMPGKRRSVMITSARSASFERVFGRAGLLHFIARGLQLQLDHAAQLLFVFDHQDRGFHAPFSPDGKEHAKHAARARFALHRDLPAVLVDDLRHDRQAQSDAARLGGEERIEDALPVLRGDAGAAIDHARSPLYRPTWRVFTVTLPCGGLACAAFRSKL